jgi:hypothetical protein
MSSSKVFLLAAAVVFAAPPIVASCSQEDDHGATVDDSCSNGVYVLVGVTDEACRAYIDAEAKVVSDTRAPSWSTPADGATLPADPPATFAWTKSATALHLAPARQQRGLLAQLGHALDPLPLAWAHGNTTGDGYVLLFRDGADKEVLRVMTTSALYTPDAAAWAKLKAAKSLKITLVYVSFVDNVLTTGTTPSAATPIRVTIGG